MSRSRKLLIAGAAVLVVGAGGVGLAQAVGGDDDQATGPDADRAKRAAVQALGGGTAVGVEREDEGGAAWEVEVQRGDRTVEVKLSSGFEPVSREGDDDSAREGQDDDRD